MLKLPVPVRASLSTTRVPVGTAVTLFNVSKPVVLVSVAPETMESVLFTVTPHATLEFEMTLTVFAVIAPAPVTAAPSSVSAKAPQVRLPFISALPDNVKAPDRVSVAPDSMVRLPTEVSPVGSITLARLWMVRDDV